MQEENGKVTKMEGNMEGNLNVAVHCQQAVYGGLLG